MEGQRRMDQRSRGGRFRAEMEMDRGFTMPRSLELGFAPAVQEPLVKLKRPKYDFERWDWVYFGWPHDRLDANLEMRDSDPNSTFEADRTASEGFLHRNQSPTCRCPEKHERDRSMQKQQGERLELDHGLVDAEPVGFSASRNCGCPEAKPILQDHGEAQQGPCAY